MISSEASSLSESAQTSTLNSFSSGSYSKIILGRDNIVDFSFFDDAFFATSDFLKNPPSFSEKRLPATAKVLELPGTSGILSLSFSNQPFSRLVLVTLKNIVASITLSSLSSVPF